jgi:DNA mismatch repair protein MutS2
VDSLATRLTEVEAHSAALAAQAEAQGIREAALKKREKASEKAAREQARSFLLDAREKVEAAIQKAEAASGEGAREARRAIEEAAAAEAAALRRLDQADGRTGGPADGIEVGARVRLDSGTVGEVLELRSDGKSVVRVGSLKLVAEPGSLTPLVAEPPGRRAAESRPSDPWERASATRERGSPSGPSRRAAESSALSASASYEIDLRGMTGDEAEQSVIAALDAAVLAEQPFLRIIHGKGTGVVRERVQQVLKRDRRVKSHAFALPNQGGSGVTVAEFAG